MGVLCFFVLFNFGCKREYPIQSSPLLFCKWKRLFQMIRLDPLLAKTQPSFSCGSLSLLSQFCLLLAFKNKRVSVMWMWSISCRSEYPYLNWCMLKGSQITFWGNAISFVLDYMPRALAGEEHPFALLYTMWLSG